MDNKINFNAIAEYSRVFASKLCDQYFEKQTTIDGSGIKEFYEIRQINLFIIQRLLFAWKKEAQQLESPYFDFTHDEVKDALNKFMNVLSRHIQMERQVFEPLLQEAVQQTLLLLISPFEFFLQQIEENDARTFSIERFIQKNKYVVVNKELAEAFSGKLDAADDLDGKKARHLLNEAVTEMKTSPADAESYLELMDKVESTRSYEFTVEDQRASQEAPAKDSSEAGEAEKPEVFTHKFEGAGSLKDSINLNQKFMFLKELFHDNKPEYESVIEAIDHKSSYAEVTKLLKPYIEKYEWDIEKEEVAEFFELISKKFKQ